MLSVRACQSFLLIMALATLPAFASRVHRADTAHHPHSSHHHSRFYPHHHRGHYKRVRHHYVRGQRGISHDRAREIQEALIKQNYLAGSPSGEWDKTTQKAMQKYQADNGWQTRITPDSRALIKLGLGPDNSADGTLLNAEAMNAPATPAASTIAPVGETLASTHIIQN
ncbi:MAG TPA: peptidoglycan-binding protein [Acidobacteriaceae bacterium]|nr:peptidoglycan-binding protein [Acidobacteriaceae bacterium]